MKGCVVVHVMTLVTGTKNGGFSPAGTVPTCMDGEGGQGPRQRWGWSSHSQALPVVATATAKSKQHKKKTKHIRPA